MLSTLNARYIHAAFGLRYLKANLGILAVRAKILEFTIEQRPIDIAEQLLADNPRIIGLGVYIWNVELSTQTAALIKSISPETFLILGGPEVSYEQEDQLICQLADRVISGPGETQFFEACQAVLNGTPINQSPVSPAALADLKLPYDLYSAEDIRNRILYVEASRGCPFKCEFCLSALDKTAKPFPLELFLDEMEKLYARGARNFKFVDRTFNLSTRVSLPIMQFFLDRMSEDLFVHFEVIPDRLPTALKNKIAKFPKASLQFEVGIQTFNPDVQAIIRRKQDNTKTIENLTWLCQHSPAYIHTDLIFGLPGETIQSMADSFNRLVAVGPDEIQLGMLKRLRGMPMAARIDEYEMVFNPSAPYEILSTRDIDFQAMQTLRRMARYWDMVANSGRFKTSLTTLLGDAPFARFMRFSEWLHLTTGQTHKISLKRLFDLMFDALTEVFTLSPEQAKIDLQCDFDRSGMKGLPQCLRRPQATQTGASKYRANKRQRIHSA